jgi:hypothetical protein
MKITFFALLLASAAGAAWAQKAPEPYATIKGVEGLVTVTTDNQLSNALRGTDLAKGAQVMATATGRVTIVFSNGCRVTLEPGQSLLVDEEACSAFLAQNTPAVGPVSAPVLLGAGALTLGVITRSSSSGS